MLSEISRMVKDKYVMVSPISGTILRKQISKQNITRDIEIKNKLTVTRGVVGGTNGWKRGKGCQEYVKGYMYKAKGVGSSMGDEYGLGARE